MGRRIITSYTPQTNMITTAFVFFLALAGPSSASGAETKTPSTSAQECGSKAWADPNWIVAGSTFVYTLMTGILIFQQRRSRQDDKLPCVVVRARLNPSRAVPGGVTTDEWKLRLINIGVGPAFIVHFRTTGIPGLSDGDHTHDIDHVLGADNGDPDQQIDFANGTPGDLRTPDAQIIVRYKDVAGREFESRICGGRAEFVRL